MRDRSTIDKTKLNRWLNIRKTTLKELNSKLKNKLNYKVNFENCETLDKYALSVISDILDIDQNKITKLSYVPTYILKKKRKLKIPKGQLLKMEYIFIIIILYQHQVDMLRLYY